MSTVIAIIAIILILYLMSKIYQGSKERVQFFINGLDAKFSFGDIKMLWEVAQLCDLHEPNSLFFSLPSLSKCMTQINSVATDEKNPNSEKMKKLMTKLFDFRTKIQNEADEKKGLDSTISLDRGQRLRIILPGHGVFVSEIVNNGSEITILMPKQNNMIPVPAADWINKTISVYLWRTGDARYVFDTTVNSQGVFLGKLCLHLKHSYNLIRTQKRQSVRAKCNIHADMFFVKGDTKNVNSVETSAGYRCLLEDISETGALIRIGGKGKPDMKIKLQFNINNKLILMYGVVRSVEYNAEINQTRLHFECLHVDPLVRNEILSYVYNMMPESEKEVYDAMKLTDSDIEDVKDGVDSELKEKVEETENAQKSLIEKNISGGMDQEVSVSSVDTQESSVQSDESQGESESEVAAENVAETLSDDGFDITNL